jgi:hypothetical protein
VLVEIAGAGQHRSLMDVRAPASGASQRRRQPVARSLVKSLIPAAFMVQLYQQG